MMLYFIGKNFNNLEKYRSYFFIAYMVPIIEKFINIDTATFHIVTRQMIGGELEGTSLYLYMGDTLAILSILVLTLAKNNYLKMVLIFLSSLALFLVYSRSSLYFYVTIVCFYILKEFNNKNKLIFIFVLLLSFGYLLSSVSVNELGNMRMLSFLFTGEDASVSARTEFLKKGIVAISNNILIGDYGGQFLEAGGNFGSKIHNILSYYRQFGIIAAIFLITLFCLSLVRYYEWFRGYYSHHDNYIFYIALFIIAEFIFARSYTSMLLWFAFGLLANKKKLKKTNTIKRKKNEKNCSFNSAK
jgi:hypothetical protein